MWLKRNWWTIYKHKHTQNQCSGTCYPVSLLQWSPGTRYCGNEQASMAATGVWARVDPEYGVYACLWVCAWASNCMLTVNLCVPGWPIFVCALGGGRASEEAFRKALIAVPLLSPAVTPSSALRLSSLITHTGNTTLIRDSTTSPNHALTWLWPKCQCVHAGLFFFVGFLDRIGSPLAIFSFCKKRWKSSSWEYRGIDMRWEIVSPRLYARV